MRANAGRGALSLFLAAMMVGGALVACGRQPGGAALPPTTGKPVGPGTPVPGAPQTLATPTGGFYESVVAADSVVFVGGADGNVYALRAGGGKLLWRHSAGGYGGVYGAAGGLVYAVAGGAGQSSRIVALRADTGAQAWQSSAYTDLMGIVVANGAVYGSTNAGGPSASSVFALRASDGSPLWRFSAPGEMPNPVTVADGIVFARAHVFSQGAGVSVSVTVTLYALRPSDGARLWSYPVPAELGTPASANGVVYVADDSGHLFALDAATGHLLWRFDGVANQPFNGITTQPAVIDGAVFIAAPDALYAIRAADGKLLWHVSRSRTYVPGIEQPLVMDGAVYYAEGMGDVSAVRTSDGSTLWHQHINNSAFHLSVEPGQVDVLTQRSVAYALRASDGTLLWQHSIDPFAGWDDLSPGATLANGVLYTGTEKGVVQALRTTDGKELWRFTIAAQPAPEPPVLSAVVTFASGVSYAQALRTVTDLGLQPTQPCVNGSAPWQPLDLKNQLQYGFLVAATPLSAPGWLALLQRAPGVQRVQTNPAYNCPLMRAATPGPGEFPYISENQVGTLARITFSTQTSYDQALDAVSTLGFRLADPCYERLPQGAPVASTSMGQESAFNTTHALVVATTRLNSAGWQQQAQVSPGVARVEVSPSVPCGG